MASGTKKRRNSHSPARGTTSKRARVTSKRTQHDEPDPQSSRAGSARDTHPAPKPSQATSLPTGEDWVFRVKVISSATDLANDLFKNAVQGLVRICFPDGILDQLGPQVLERHMREEKAPEHNIERMEDVFRFEMTQRVASMVAEHLDTADKVDAVLKTILTTSARAHVDNLGDDILDHVTASLLKLKAKASEHSTEWLAGGDEAQEEDSSDEDMNVSHFSDREPTMPPKTKKKERDKESKRGRPSAGDPLPTSTKPYVSVLATPLPRPNSKSKDRKISSKWQWDVDAAVLTEDDIAGAFSRTGDLFAYHALPISRRKLGPTASKKEIRCEMQSLLDGMPTEEFRKWVESLQKLLNGDREMLKRVDTYSPDDEQRLSRATPAPIDTRRRSRKATKDTSSRLTNPGDYPESASRPSRPEAVVKLEVVTNLTKPPENDQRKSLSEATTTFRNPSTEKRLLQASMRVLEEVKRRKTRSHGSQLDEAPWVEDQIPITILLWGKSSVTRSQCLDIARTIMDNLHRRSPTDCIRTTEVDGTNATLTKTNLEDAIVGAFPEPGLTFSFINTLKVIERSLIPWVVVNLSAFPELRTRALIFINLMVDLPIMINLLFGSWSAISTLNGLQAWDSLSQVLRRRGISEATATECQIKFKYIKNLFKDQPAKEQVRLHIFERNLRRVAFHHRERFPELKATHVVKAWERKTGLTW